MIKRQFLDQGPRWISTWPVVRDGWSASLQTFEGHSGWVSAVIFSPNGHIVVLALGDKTLRLWDAQTGALRSMLEGHSRRVNAVTFSPDSQVVASASWDMTVRLWDAQTGVLCSTLEGQGFPSRLSFGNDGSYLKTNRGRIDLEIPAYNTILIVDHYLGYSLSKDYYWITWNGYNVLWLLPEYCPVCSAFQEYMLVIGHSSGQVTFTRFQSYIDISQFC